MRRVRTAVASDLGALQALYLHLNPARPDLPPETAARILGEILARPDCHLFVAFSGGTLVASCMLGTMPNLMRGGRPYALLENVVTHADHRRQGHARAVVEAALAAAWGAGAYQVYLLTARTNPAVRLFYESCGFETGRKAGYVASSPKG
ncbi:GNAT family N-acetyltransferase [Roseococcus pinisoli]|uniref:GNAT family N-acetyltransferase n=1 Tax=Roseococcus pinisoli TaxID=2835040 RepID=A0ABS5QAD9_9PROT|nr:GNAT family N-acetyltransferase [Roseococcus pinisoli]MBS7810661.1 GNAT family N-acetyltransferase [Roseococcus pinisoli]